MGTCFRLSFPFVTDHIRNTSSNMQNTTAPPLGASLLDKMLRVPSPISYTFISHLSLDDILNLLLLSKTFRTALIDPDQYGYIFQHLSLNRLSSPFHRVAKHRYNSRWMDQILPVTNDDILSPFNVREIIFTLEPMFGMVKYLSLDSSPVYVGTLENVVSQLVNLTELSVRHAFGITMKGLLGVYGRDDHPNPRLEKLNFWNLCCSASERWNTETLDAALQLGERYETDVTVCEKTHCVHPDPPLKWRDDPPPWRCGSGCERREWTCTSCGNVEKNICMGGLYQRVCGICEEFCCKNCLPEVKNRMYCSSLFTNNIRGAKMRKLGRLRAERRRFDTAIYGISNRARLHPSGTGFANNDFAYVSCNRIYHSGFIASITPRHYFHEACYIESTSRDLCTFCQKLPKWGLHYPKDWFKGAVVEAPRCELPECASKANAAEDIENKSDENKLAKCFRCERAVCYDTCAVSCVFCGNHCFCLECSKDPEWRTYSSRMLNIEGQTHRICLDCDAMGSASTDWIMKQLSCILTGNPMARYRASFISGQIQLIPEQT